MKNDFESIVLSKKELDVLRTIERKGRMADKDIYHFDYLYEKGLIKYLDSDKTDDVGFPP